MGQLLDQLGFMGKVSKLKAILREENEFTRDCLQSASRLCLEVSKHYYETAKTTIETFIKKRRV